MPNEWLLKKKKKKKREKRTRKCGRKKEKKWKKTKKKKTKDNTNTFYFYFNDFWAWDWRMFYVVLFRWNCIAENFVAQFDSKLIKKVSYLNKKSLRVFEFRDSYVHYIFYSNEHYMSISHIVLIANTYTSFREVPTSVKKSPAWLKHIYSVLCALTWRRMPPAARSNCAIKTLWRFMQIEYINMNVHWMRLHDLLT